MLFIFLSFNRLLKCNCIFFLFWRDSDNDVVFVGILIMKGKVRRVGCLMSVWLKIFFFILVKNEFGGLMIVMFNVEFFSFVGNDVWLKMF